MYLSDKDLTIRLFDESKKSRRLYIECDKADHPFSLEQISPSSIDLRISDTFWEFRKGIIDLGDDFSIDKTRDKYWNKIQLRDSKEFIVLKPGQCILGRTYEKITIPRDCAAKIEPKSGANRLSLLITLGDYCNPGYSGYYPLQIVNLSKHKIKLYPYISLCQLCLIQLSSETNQHYDETYNYQNDDGGPAKWWNDKQIKKLKVLHEGKDFEHIISEVMGNCNEDEKIVVLNKLKQFYHSNERIPKDDLIAKFEESERKAYKQNRNLIKALKGVPFIPIIALVGIWARIVFDFFSNGEAGANFNFWRIMFVSISIITVILAIYFFGTILLTKLDERIYYKPKSSRESS